MARVSQKSAGLAVNPLVQDLLASGEDGALVVGGYVGKTDNEHVRLYADLTLSRSLELAKADIVRVVEPREPDGPAIVFFKRSAELKYVETGTFTAEQVLGAIVSRPLGCGCGGGGSNSAVALQQQTGGPGGGPVVDLCEWGCMERFRLCAAGTESSWSKFWCAVSYFWCRLGCSNPGPIIV